MKKSRWYLFLFAIGILLIITGIYTLTDAVSKNDKTAIWIRALMVFFWTAFTISNYFLYKKEKRKRNEP